MTSRAFIAGCLGTSLTADERAFFRDARPWGFIVFKRNTQSPEQVAALTAEMRETVGWQHTFTPSDTQTVVAGIDYVHEQGENRDTFSGLPNYEESRNNTGLYAGWQGGFGALDAEVSARHDDNSVFGTTTTGSAALGWRFRPRSYCWVCGPWCSQKLKS